MAIGIIIKVVVCEECHGDGGQDAVCLEGPGYGGAVGFVPCPACEGSGRQYEFVPDLFEGASYKPGHGGDLAF